MKTSSRGSFALDLAEFRLGWRVLILTLFGIATAVVTAPLYAFGPLVVPLQEAFGWQRGEIQPAIAFMYGSSVIAMQFTGWLNTRYGMRPVTLYSLIALPAVYLLMTLNTGSIWQLYLGFALMAFAGVGTMHVTWTQLICLWFEKNRGLALAIALCGTGLSAVVMPILVSMGVERWGWRAGFWVLALIPLLFTLPLAFCWLSSKGPIIVQRAESSDPEAASGLSGLMLRDVVKSRRFLVLNLALVLAVSSVVGMVTNSVPMMRDNGLSAVDAAQVFGVFGITLIVGRVIVGYLIDRLWAPSVAFAVLLLPALGCFIYATQPSNIPMLILASALVGLGAGAEMDIASYLVARYFGLRDYSRVFSVHSGIITLCTCLAPVLFGRLYENTGSYSAMLTYCTISFAVASMLILTLGRYPVLPRVSLAGS
jgi:MFS family permease